MVNKEQNLKHDSIGSNELVLIRILITTYSYIVMGSVIGLVIFALTNSSLATADVWTHTIIVAFFAIILRKRSSSISVDKPETLRALGIIAAVLFLVNVIEALIPNFMPLWVRVVMFVIAALMLGIIGLIIKLSIRIRA